MADAQYEAAFAAGSGFQIDLADLNMMRGQLRHDQGRLDEAAECYANAAKLFGDEVRGTSTVMFEISRALLALETGCADEATRALLAADRALGAERSGAIGERYRELVDGLRALVGAAEQGDGGALSEARTRIDRLRDEPGFFEIALLVRLTGRVMEVAGRG